MKFYIATRFANEELKKRAIEIKVILEKRGHEMLHDWMNMPSIRPYNENIERATELAQIDLKALGEIDVFILLPHPDGTGMYVEYGFVLNQFEQTGAPKIYILGDNRNCSMFNYHPSATWKETIEEILEDLKSTVL